MTKYFPTASGQPPSYLTAWRMPLSGLLSIAESGPSITTWTTSSWLVPRAPIDAHTTFTPSLPFAPLYASRWQRINAMNPPPASASYRTPPYMRPDKLQAIHVSLATWADRHSCSKRELLSLIGTLSFAAKVAPACRTFLRRMIDLSSSVASLDDTITISDPFQSDLRWWREFATLWYGFLLPDWTPAPHLQLFTIHQALPLSHPHAAPGARPARPNI